MTCTIHSARPSRLSSGSALQYDNRGYMTKNEHWAASGVALTMAMMAPMAAMAPLPAMAQDADTTKDIIVTAQ